MIIDTHAHSVFPGAITSFVAGIVASRANPTVGKPRVLITDEMLYEPMARQIANMEKVGTDFQIISPRPFLQLHSDDPQRSQPRHHRLVAVHDQEDFERDSDAGGRTDRPMLQQGRFAGNQRRTSVPSPS